MNIAVSLDEISQMCHFLIVNTTQRSVDRESGRDRLRDNIAAVRTISTNKSPVSPQATQRALVGLRDRPHSSHARFISSFCAMSVIKTKAVRIRPLIVPTSAKFAST